MTWKPLKLIIVISKSTNQSIINSKFIIRKVITRRSPSWFIQFTQVSATKIVCFINYQAIVSTQHNHFYRFSLSQSVVPVYVSNGGKQHGHNKHHG